VADLNISISSAQVATFGEKAVDVFYVVDATKKKIIRENVQKLLSERLLEVLEADPAA
jgi:[protein-PII] uridylyltransferase